MTNEGNHPLAIEPRFRRAAIAAMWFAAGFCVVFAALAIASAAGLIGQQHDAPMFGLMALGGAVLAAVQFALNRFFLKLPPKARID